MKTPQKNALEWAVFGVSLVLVLAALGYLIFWAVSQRSDRPYLTVRPGTPMPQAGGGGFVVPVTVFNQGDRTTEDVQVQVRLVRDGEAVETVDLVFPLLPYGSQREGEVVFRQDPSSGVIEAYVTGYLQP